MRPTTNRVLLTAFFLTAAGAASADSCIDQAHAAARRIQAEVVPSLSQEQLARVAAISAELCSGRAGPSASVSSDSEDVPAPSGHSDWIGYLMFEHSADKNGNKRLKRLK